MDLAGHAVNKYETNIESYFGLGEKSNDKEKN